MKSERRKNLIIDHHGATKEELDEVEKMVNEMIEELEEPDRLDWACPGRER